jgi:hypothetical protein
MDRFAPSGTSNLELRFVVKAVMTSCASSRRRLADPDVPQVVKVVATQPLSKDACQQKSAPACAKVKSCIWTSDPTQVPADPTQGPAFPTCVARSSVARWACPNILTSAACASNRACVYVKKTKKCAFKPEKTSKTG